MIEPPDRSMMRKLFAYLFALLVGGVAVAVMSWSAARTTSHEQQAAP